MGLDDRDYMRNPDRSGPGRNSKAKSGWGFDGTLVIGILVAGLVMSAFIVRGFEQTPAEGYDPMAIYGASLDAGQIQIHVNEAPREELLIIPMISERIADGIIAARPLKMSEDLLDVKGVGELNIEIMLMYLYGFEDIPEPRLRRPLGVPDV